jgi:hypothetical protein
MNDIAALLPPVLTAIAFIVIIIGVKRFADREADEEREHKDS